jgi:hypothetical protein
MSIPGRKNGAGRSRSVTGVPITFADHVRDLKAQDPILYSNQHFEAIKPVGSKIFPKARIVRQAVRIDSKMLCYDFTDLDDEIALHGPAPCIKARTRITVSQRLQERIGFTTGHELEVPYVRYRTLNAKA